MSNRISTVIKAVTDLPARLWGGNAQKVEVSGLDYTLHLDLEKLPPFTPSGALGKWTVIWDETTDTYRRVEFTNLPPSPGSPGLDDEAVDDRVAALLQAGANVAIVYDDAGNRLTIHGIAPGGSTGPQNVFDTIHDARLATVPAAVKSIVLMGYNRPGDAGPSMQCRRTAGPVTLHAGWFRTTDRYTAAGVVDATNGGYWEYAARNYAIAVEWFGAIGDYTIVNQDGSGWSVNPTPTDNRQAIINATKFIWVHGGNGGLGFGGTVLFSMAQYYVSDEIQLDRAVGLHGVSSGYYHDGATTKLIFAAGKKGLVIRNAGEGINGAASTIIRNIYIASLGFGGFTDKHGIEMKGAIVMEHCSVRGFGGNGIQIHADINVGTNANLFYLNHCAVYSNAKSGVSCQGGDANAGIGIAINAVGNGEWGIYDNSFLANCWTGCHTSGNGNLVAGTGGGYYGAGSAIFDGCYGEGDQGRSYAGPGCLFLGGTHGNGVTCEGGNFIYGGGNVGGFNIGPQASIGALESQPISIGFRQGKDVLYRTTFGAPGAAGTSFYDWHYTADNGIFTRLNNQAFDWGYGLTPPEGAIFRDPRIPANRFMVPYGMFLGSVQAGAGVMRILASGPAVPTTANVDYRKGDIHLNHTAAHAGWMCYADGVSAATWVSGTIYIVGSVIRTPGGKVYQCTKIPFDPDYWVIPPFTVQPVHTSGAVSYPEPNPIVYPGIPATIPGYTWNVVPDQPNYVPWDYVVGQTFGDNASARVRNDAGIAFANVAPFPTTRPPKVFDQTWTMPGSTVEPTHTTATAVEYPQPNPAPSGSEPATIPGYHWRYITSNPPAKWAGFGELFLESATYNWTPPAITNGTSSAVQTVTVTGARLGDLAEATIRNPFAIGGTQGLDVVAWVTNNDEVKFQLHNRTGATVTMGAMSWVVRVRKWTGPPTAMLLPALPEHDDG